jgi:hypothetical protein
MKNIIKAHPTLLINIITGSSGGAANLPLSVWFREEKLPILLLMKASPDVVEVPSL